ncbi:fimbrial protein [Brenneria goodwinii]|uniref:fimbrial protein n=1 Tax=Brenneria goodwinii TaxID=1109412 RepID=UPI0036E3B2EB
MNKKLIGSAISAVIFLGSVPASYATDGTINFTGVISASSCSVNSVAGTSSTAGTVDFGTVSSSTFGTAGSRTVGTPFSIELTDCAVSTSPDITFNGTAVTAAGYTELFATDIDGLGIRIGDAGDSSVTYSPGVSTANTGLSALASDVTQADASFTAWLVDYTGSSSYAGTIDTDVTFTIDYAES